MKVGDLVEHTVFKFQRSGIILEFVVPPRAGCVTVLWPNQGARTESLFLLRLISESR